MKWSRSDVIAAVLIALTGGVMTFIFGILAWNDWTALQHQRRVIASGLEAHAEFKGTRHVSTRADTRYLVNITLKDHKGANRTMNGVPVSKEFFQKVEAGRKSALLKYLPAEPQVQPAFVEDAAALESERIWNIQGRFFALLVGFAAGGFGFWVWRRRTAAARP